MIQCNDRSWQLCTNIHFSWKIDYCSQGRGVQHIIEIILQWLKISTSSVNKYVQYVGLYTWHHASEYGSKSHEYFSLVIQFQDETRGLTLLTSLQPHSKPFLLQEISQYFPHYFYTTASTDPRILRLSRRYPFRLGLEAWNKCSSLFCHNRRPKSSSIHGEKIDFPILCSPFQSPTSSSSTCITNSIPDPSSYILLKEAHACHAQGLVGYVSRFAIGLGLPQWHWALRSALQRRNQYRVLFSAKGASKRQRTRHTPVV